MTARLSSKFAAITVTVLLSSIALISSIASATEFELAMAEQHRRTLTEVLEAKHNLDNAVWMLRLQVDDPAFTFSDFGSARSIRDRENVSGRIEVGATAFGFPAKNVTYIARPGIGLRRNPEQHSHRSEFFEVNYYLEGNPENVISAVASSLGRPSCDDRDRYYCRFRLEDRLLKLSVNRETTTSVSLTYYNPFYVPNPANQDCC